MKLKPLELGTRTKGDDDGTILMVQNPTKEDWDELRNQYPNQKAFETRQVLTGMPIQQALLGIIFWLKSKDVVFYTNLKDREVLKFSWGVYAGKEVFCVHHSAIHHIYNRSALEKKQ